MKKTWAQVVMAAWVLTGGLGSLGMAAAAGANDRQARITVYVRNYAHLDHKTLAQAGEVAKGILGKAGLTVTIVVLAPGDNYPEGPTPDELNFSIRVLSREMTRRLGLRTTLMGLAPGEEHDRTDAFVFAHRAAELARLQPDAGFAKILGHAMAHEIGHLFNLPHCPQGIMQVRWEQKEMHAMSMGWLNFSRQQAAQMQAELTRRTRQPQTAEMHSLLAVNGPQQ